MIRVLLCLFLTLNGQSQTYRSYEMSFTPDQKIHQIYDIDYTITVVNPTTIHFIDMVEVDTVCIELEKRLPDRIIEDCPIITYKIVFEDRRKGVLIFAMKTTGELDAVIVSDHTWIMVYRIFYEQNLSL